MTFTQSFQEFSRRLGAISDSASKAREIDDYLHNRSIPVVEGASAHFIYRGPAHAVALPGEFNGWNPSHGPMWRVPNTDLFHRTETFPSDGRVEYKIWADGAWMLDPLNGRKARGGYGENSDLWMPDYRPPQGIAFDPDIPRGKMDTLWLASKSLGRSHAVFVYSPHAIEEHARLPVLYVTDGNDYLAFAQMNTVLDNLLAAGHIRPLRAVFISPRTDLSDDATNKRMIDYAASEAFLDFLQHELAPLIERSYPSLSQAHDRAIMGVSMGGLISTYAVIRRPEFIVKAAAQSPAYRQADGAVPKLLSKIDTCRAIVYIDAGTIGDTQAESLLVSKLLRDRGASVHYSEYPEGHNWSNWRSRLRNILEYFFPAR